MKFCLTINIYLLKISEGLITYFKQISSGTNVEALDRKQKTVNTLLWKIQQKRERSTRRWIFFQ